MMLLLAVFLALGIFTVSNASWAAYISEACSIYCIGTVLSTIQLSGIFNDSKTFVDMPMKFDPSQVQANFDALPNTTVATLKTFLYDNFDPAGSDLVPYVPTDFTNEPPFLEMITNSTIREWASNINQLWLLLAKQVTPDVNENPQRHSFVPRDYPMIVPGGRFRESYYWDSYWIIKGLLVCNMPQTAWDVISNLITDVGNFGFVPNGGRIYYLDRSQPPLLTEMVSEYLDFVGWDTTTGQQALSEVFPVLEEEYQFWMNPENKHVVSLQGHLLNLYHSNGTTPRPESYVQDITTCTGLADPVSCYANIRTGAETGWDFSSRWLPEKVVNVTSIQNIDTTAVLPVDLNSILYRVELTLASMTQYMVSNDIALTGDRRVLELTSEDYLQAAQARYEAIQALLWDEPSSRWLDYNVSSQTRINAQESSSPRDTSREGVSDGSYSTIASWIPMWAGIASLSSLHEQARTHQSPLTSTPLTKQLQRQQLKSLFSSNLARITKGGMSAVVKGASNVSPSQIVGAGSSSLAATLVESLKESGLIQAAGVLTTTLHTGQQWDAPNAWPPLVLFTIEGLKSLNYEEATTLAEEITTSWLNTNFIAFNLHNYMYEKYNAFEIGVGGGGGEYKPQKGFGWTNGVALSLIEELYPEPEEPDEHKGIRFSAMLIAAIILIFTASIIGLYTLRMSYIRRRNYNAYKKLVQSGGDAVFNGIDKTASHEAFVDDDSRKFEKCTSDDVDERRDSRRGLVEQVL